MHVIDQDTKVIGRLYPEPNNRGLNIYNPYFADANINAVYLLFSNPDLQELLRATRAFHLAGAIPAGFEHDTALVAQMDELDPIARRIQRVSAIVNDNGKLVGYYNGGAGYAEAIKVVTPLVGKRVVIMGAGTVVRALLAYLELANEYPISVAIYNRTLARARAVAQDFQVERTGTLDEMLESADGDILIHATDVGTPWNKGDDLEFPASFLKRFKTIADTTFAPVEPPLIATAKAAGIKTVPGWQMFVHQGAKGMKDILGVSLDIPVLSKLAYASFQNNLS